MELNFFLSEQDQARIDPNSIVVEDLSANSSPSLPQLVKDTATPQSLLIRFRIIDPDNGPPKIKLFFSGHLNYIPDSHESGVIPNMEDIDTGLSKFNEWNTKGIIRIQADKESVDHLETLNSALIPFGTESPVVPNQLWYYPICITREFILSFLSLSKKVVLTESGDTIILASGHPTSAATRLAEFFKSRFAEWIRSGANISNSLMQSLPTVKMNANGEVTLVIGMARTQEPQDQKDLFDNYNPKVNRLLPQHVSNGAIPPRYIFRKFKSALHETASNSALATELLKEPPQATDYVPIQYTRTAKRVLNCSLYFPGRQVQISDNAGTNLWTQRLPSHGIVFLPKAPNQLITTINLNDINFDSTVSVHHLKGVDDNWKLSPDPNPLAFNLGNEPRPHVVLRLSMSAEMLREILYGQDIALQDIERAISEDRELSSCSYMSMRRTVHALLNNRIAGGRYNFVGKSTEFRNELIEEIFPANLAFKVRNRLPSTRFTGSKENQTDQIRERANVLRQVLEVMFPESAPEYLGGNASTSGTYPIGRVAYHLWQSILDEFKGSNTKKYYSDDHIGRGAPGALMALGLAEYVLDPQPGIGENYNSPSFLADIVNRMLNDIQPGTPLQFWRLGSDFRKTKERKNNTSYGHSPMYLMPSRPEDTFDGFWVIDHNGAAVVKREPASQLLNWTTSSDYVEEIWIAARWLE